MPEPEIGAVPQDDGAAEDAKLVVLARAAAQRAGGRGAAVRDVTGRTYVAGPVDLASLHLTPLQAAVVGAVASGALAGSGRIDAVAVVGATASLVDRQLLAELGDPTVLTG